VREKVLIKGAGEMASATGHRLFNCGFQVVMTDIEEPTAVRRTVSFCSAIYQDEITIEGVRCKRHAPDKLAFLDSFDWSHIPVIADPEGLLLKKWHPEIVVDGRMLKKNLDNRLNDADLVIGLGPGIEAGKDVHYVVETNRGHRLGRIINQGEADPNTGKPGSINGYTYERVLKAPSAGVFESNQKIGNTVQADDLIGSVAGSELRAKLKGVIRGMIMPGIHVNTGQKLADIDPRGDASFCDLISDKARTISGSVLEIVITHVNKKNN
jgi:xanthine dehydrogenase accessory factor